MEYPIKDFLRDLRIRRGYTQEYVSSHIGVSRQAYSNYENGTTEPSLSVIISLIDMYEIDVKGIIQKGMKATKQNHSYEPLKTLEVNMVDCMRKVPMEVQRQMYDYACYLKTKYINEKKRKF